MALVSLEIYYCNITSDGNNCIQKLRSTAADVIRAYYFNELFKNVFCLDELQFDVLMFGRVW